MNYASVSQIRRFGCAQRAQGTHRGMVTVELAIGILALAMVTVMLGFAVSLVGLHGACADVASQVARQLARDDFKAADAAKARAPKNASIRIDNSDSLVRVEVSVNASIGRVGMVPISATAVASHE